jgi:hypothetical protein
LTVCGDLKDAKEEEEDEEIVDGERLLDGVTGEVFERAAAA